MMVKKQQDTKQKLDALRAAMAARGLDGYIVPMADEFQCEYAPEHAKRLKWLTGFSGSAGDAAVLKDKALMLSDERYTIRLKNEVDASLFDVSDQRGKAGALAVWLTDNAAPGSKIGYDPMLYTSGDIDGMNRRLRAKKIELVAVEGNMVDALWADRPAAPADPVRLFSDSVAGRTAAEKRELVADAVRNSGGKAVVIAKADSVNWLLNVRGSDVKHTPLALSRVIVHDDGRTDWFIEPSRVPDAIRQHLGGDVTIRAPGELATAVQTLAQESKAVEKCVLVDADRTPVWFSQVLRKAGAEVIDETDPCIEPRACKTLQEQAAIREAHIRDGVAMVRFLKWFDEETPKGCLTEMDVCRKLEGYRRKDSALHDLSFPTIAGWNANGADIHREVKDENNALITPPGMLLLDSGGQYRDLGTTDITRTISVGAPSDDMKKDFTLVLQGLIALAGLQFPKGERGVHVDAFARKALWDARKEYGHGTGHGVGAELGVHEDASGVSKRVDERSLPLKPGMLMSNEPGFYPGQYGIRIECLQLVVESGLCQAGPGKTTPMYGFEVVTLCPIDRRLVMPEMLDEKELQWINEYHDRVYKTLSPRLEPEVNAWLRQATAPLKKNLTPAMRAPGWGTFGPS